MEQLGIGIDWDAGCNRVAQPMAEEPSYTRPKVTFDPDTVQPSCRARIPRPLISDPTRMQLPDGSCTHKEQLEKWLANVYQVCRRTKMRVTKLEQESEAAILQFEALASKLLEQESEARGHSEWKRMTEDEWEKMTTSVSDQFQRLITISDSRAELATKHRAESAEHIVLLRTELQTELKKLLFDHKGDNIKLVDTCQKDYLEGMVDMMNVQSKVLRSTALAQQQADRNQKTPECCCISFWPCFRTKQKVAVVQPGIRDSSSSTAAQPSQLISEQAQIISGLENKVAQIEAKDAFFSPTGGGGLFSSGGLGKGGGGLFCSGGGGLFSSGGLGNQGASH